MRSNKPLVVTTRQHGGPDAAGPVRWDFSVCANAAGPCPMAIEAVRAADLVRYPDPASLRLRELLAAVHEVEPRRILIAVSASEFVQRITAVAVRLSPAERPIEVPVHGYGDYAAAALAWGRKVRRGPLAEGQAGLPPALRWLADPSSPAGRDGPPPLDPAALPTVLDAVYAPLRLDGASAWRPAERDAVFELHGPNKALGLCGLRGAYAIAPRDPGWPLQPWLDGLEALCPSWPLSAPAAAMLEAWTRPDCRRWLAMTLPQLSQWRAGLGQMLRARGFEIATSTAPFFCVRPPSPGGPPGQVASRVASLAARLAADLAAADVRVRDCASFGLAGWWRVNAQPPEAIAALDSALARASGA